MSLSVDCQPTEPKTRSFPVDPSTSAFSVTSPPRPSCAQHQQPLPEEVDWSSYDIPAWYRREDNEGPIKDAWPNLNFGLDSDTGELLVDERTHKYQSDRFHDKRDSLPRRFLGRGRALRDFVARKDYEVTVRKGDELLILEHPARSVSKCGIESEWEGWVKVRLLRNGKEGEVPSSQIMDVDMASSLKREAVKRWDRSQSLESPLPEPTQLIAGVGHTSVSDSTALARLARQ